MFDLLLFVFFFFKTRREISYIKAVIKLFIIKDNAISYSMFSYINVNL